VAKRVWEPLAQVLPPGTTTVYLACDGTPTRLPWGALPGRQPGTVLLEELALVVVPHGPFLLEQLMYPPQYPRGKEAVLALGGVDYGPAQDKGYAALPGTAAEVQQVLRSAAERPTVRLEKEGATWAALREALPRARYAHLATHGFYDVPALAAELQREKVLRKAWTFDPERPAMWSALGLRSPLSYTGLVLAGVNRTAAAQEAVVTGETLVDLPLEGLRLCVLSACDTSLGAQFTNLGEGVQGLPRALHLAGCANVVASLWPVNDQATAALMTRFYHVLWTEGKTPLEALRQAQLAVYRHPEQLAAWAQERRPPSARDTVPVPATPPQGAARTPTKLWAGFVLSGVGQ
jgi:CHAT domain-containing protein